MFIGFTVDDDATVENPSVFVELPSAEVVANACMFCAFDFAFQKSNTPAAKVVVKRMSQANGFVFNQLPTGMKTTDVVGHIASKESVFAALDFVFETLAVIGELRLFTGLEVYQAEEK